MPHPPSTVVATNFGSKGIWQSVFVLQCEMPPNPPVASVAKNGVGQLGKVNVHVGVCVCMCVAVPNSCTDRRIRSNDKSSARINRTVLGWLRRISPHV